MQLSSGLLYFIACLLHLQLAVFAKVRGIPGADYPNYSSIPKTSFKCPDYKPGFYADLETRCQVFHYCYEHRKESFLCPEGTIFNKAIKSCDYWYSSECDTTQTSHVTAERKLKQSPYNDALFVPVNIEDNNIFNKMAALYEPKKHTENFIRKEQEERADNNYLEDSTDYGNGNSESDSYPLSAQEILIKEMTENDRAEDNIRDFVKYEHDSVEEDEVDIKFHDNSVQIFPYNNKAQISSIGSPSETETRQYLKQDTPIEIKDKYEAYHSEEQNKLFTIHFPQAVHNINLSDHKSSDSLLIKRLSDNLDAPKKRKFRRKPTYVVLQTEESDESPLKSTAYGVEQNQPMKAVNVDKSNAYPHAFHPDSPVSGFKQTENKLKEDSAQKSDRKFRRNRNKLAEQSELTNETKFEKEYKPTRDMYIDTANVYQSSDRGPIISNFLKAEGKSEDDIEMSVKKPRQNRKKFDLLGDKLDEDNDKAKEVKENETRKNIHDDKQNRYLQTISDSFKLDDIVAENKPEDLKKSVGKLSRNEPGGMNIDEPTKTNAKLTESTERNHEFIMSANIMSPSFETDEEPVILVSNSAAISEANTFITTKPVITQSTVSITTTAPDSLVEKEPEKADNIMKNSSHAEESYINSHKLKVSETDYLIKKPQTYESNPEGFFEKVTQKNHNFIPPLLNLNTEVEGNVYLEEETNSDIGMSSADEDFVYSEQDTNLDDKNMHLEIEDNLYLEEANSDTTSSADEDFMYSEQGMNLEDNLNIQSDLEDNAYPETNSDSINTIYTNEDSVYSEQEMSTDNTLYVNPATETTYSEQETYPHYVDMGSEFEELDYSGENMNLGDFATHMIDEDSSHGISNEILKPDAQTDQHDGDNDYGNEDSTFSGSYNTFSQTFKSDSNNYVLISTLSSIITDESSTANVLDEDNNEHFLTYGKKDEQMYYVNNLNEMYPEHEDKLKFVDEKINSDMNAEISDLINEDEDLESNKFHKISDDAISTESTLFDEDVNYDYEGNAELRGLEKSSDLNPKEGAPLKGETHYYEEQQRVFDLESSTTWEGIAENIPKNTESSYQTNSSYNESFESSIVEEDSKLEKEVESLGSSTSEEGLNGNKMYEYGTNVDEEPLENFHLIENLKDININEKKQFAKITDADSSEAKLFDIYQSANIKLPSKSFDELEGTTMLTNTRKDTLLEAKLKNEAEISDNLNNHLTENRDFNKLVLNKFEINPANTIKATSEFGEKSQNEEEKPIDSVFHSSSMPLPANIFEQGLYKQNLIQDENYQINRDKIYPSTFYRELDESQGNFKNEKSAAVDTSHNKKYRSLNSNFPLDEMNLENADHLSSNYREPSLFSLFEPPQSIKKLLPLDFFGLKSSSFYSPPVGKILKPIKVRKLVSFGKNLLAFKKTKLNDFRLMFDSLMNEM